MDNLLRFLITSNSRAALAFSESEILYRMQMESNITISICPEVFITLPIVIYTRKNFYLIDALNAQIKSLQASGLIDYWQANAFVKTSKQPTEREMRQTLKLSHLSGCFQLYVCFVLISFLVFVGEFFMSKIDVRRCF